MNRRSFLKHTGACTIPVITTAFTPAMASFHTKKENQNLVNFVIEGLIISPAAYAQKLHDICIQDDIKPDSYGAGGAVLELEKRFAQITGKGKAIYLPSGTMANQLALKLLSGENTKIFVQEDSHVFRDEADAAQAVHFKRLIPLRSSTNYTFTQEDLQSTLQNLDEVEVFKSGYGAVSIENPIRRSDGRYVSLEEIESISTYCRKKGLKLHLDGARIYYTSAYSGISIKEISSYFDTVYISLYKYLGAAGGAILAGDATLIDKIPRLIKIFGGTIYQSWPNAAMALHNLNTIENKITMAKAVFEKLSPMLNEIEGISITSIDHGTNIFGLKLDENIDGEKFTNTLFTDYQILLRNVDKKNVIKLHVNESILLRDPLEISAAFQTAISRSQ